ncbi:MULTISPECIES: hypothetical protein [unclassified Aureimonas]|uniref:hypothetical protein n=1 Tax=unclassified Aureimonas TaxID=2615206 RepID=UPI0006FB5011|nr:MULTISPECIES: hypothetical protein [unclassified Aureimonas]KQT52200.1 hypothetical protein ASG62_16205 [Aureimonas sp. Leaf427]KQT70568.1 hypothetical protein ASG54_21750 [Aureimonas sp. Leaf460]
MSREVLPHRRPSENEEIVFAGMPISVTFGYTDDARITEVFMSTRKVGTMMDIAVRDLAVTISLALQYGVTPTVLERSLTADESGKPEGLAGKIVAMIRERAVA